MKNIQLLIGLVLLCQIFFSSCEKPAEIPATFYDCNYANFVDNSANHPMNDQFQSILEEGQRMNIVGASMLVKDQNGTWMGGAGKADIANNIDVQACQPFLIGSISKVFTATVVMALVDDGLLTLDDPVNQWIDRSVTDKIDNANESNLRHLLHHTSGIPDYYTTQYELDRINRVYQGHSQWETLEYTYNQSATNAVGASYYYSNTNFILLGLIAEAASGKTLEQLYKEKIFAPLNLESAWYSESEPIPAGTVRGYVEIYGNGQFTESEFLYKDELITADGGIICNVYDLARFMEGLYKGELISQEQLNEMMDWEDIPEDWTGPVFGHNRNGQGFEYFTKDYGYAIGHLGGVDGFSTVLLYFPEKDFTYVYFQNSVGDSDASEFVYQEIAKLIFN